MALTLTASAQDLPVTEKLVQSTDVPLETHIGGQLFKIARTGPLPNIFGKGDIFGRTVDRGFLELRYQGQTPEGKTVFRLIDVDVRSNETTMNRLRIGITTGSAVTTVPSGGSSAYTRGSAITIVGQEGRNEALPPNTTEFAVDLEKKREFKFGSVSVAITEADETSIKYVLRQAVK